MTYRKHWSAQALVALTIGIAVGVVHAQPSQVILHEFIESDVVQDLQLEATTQDGNFPAALQTQSGVVQAPDTSRKPTATELAYGGSSHANLDKSYSPDRDTRRPTVGTYDDPFSPSIDPYKRLRAFDTVRADFTLGVSSSVNAGSDSLQPSGPVRAGEDAFWAEMTVDVVPDEWVRIPSVAPQSRLVGMTTNPMEQLNIYVDSADNWWVRARQRSRVRVILHLAVDQRVFGGGFDDAPVPAMQPGFVSLLPSNVASSAQQVIEHLGLQTQTSRRVAVMQLVTYLRQFIPSAEMPRGHENIYLDLALSKKGVCRHRAYVFVVTALGLGIPARMVLSETHAWVEVRDASIWRRIDLGGASTRLDSDPHQQPAVRHRPAPDPFPWPIMQDTSVDGPDSGQHALERSQRRSADQGSNRFTPSGHGPLAESQQQQLQAHQQQTDHRLTRELSPVIRYSDGTVATDRGEVAPKVPAVISVREVDTTVQRGDPFRLQGRVQSSKGSCSFARVDVFLVDSQSKHRYELGALSTDEQGSFSGAVVVPQQVPVGDYDVVVKSAGTDLCAGGRSEVQ